MFDSFETLLIFLQENQTHILMSEIINGWRAPKDIEKPTDADQDTLFEFQVFSRTEMNYDFIHWSHNKNNLAAHPLTL